MDSMCGVCAGARLRTPYVPGQAVAQARHIQTDERREQGDERAGHRGHKPALLQGRPLGAPPLRGHKAL